MQVGKREDDVKETFTLVLASCSHRLRQFVRTVSRNDTPGDELLRPVGDLLSRVFHSDGLFMGQVQRQFKVAPEDVIRNRPYAGGASTGASLGLEPSGVVTQYPGGIDCENTVVTGQVVGPMDTCCGPFAGLPKDMPVSLDPTSGRVSFKYETPYQLGLLLATIVSSNRTPECQACDLSPVVQAAVSEIHHHPAFTFKRVQSSSEMQPIWCVSLS